MKDIPSHLRTGPFGRATALAAGVSARVLEGPQFRRIHESVYCHRDHELTWADQVSAAHLGLPPGAATTGLTRVQQLGLDLGPRLPLHFVLPGDCHRHLHDVFLHRTVKMPPCDDVGVTPGAAYVECCRWLRTIDVIKIGDWLLNRAHADLDEIRSLVADEPWRAGSDQAAWVLPLLSTGSRSLPESDLRSLLVFAGLPEPEVNVPVELNRFTTVVADLWYPAWRVCAEYEGRQHQADRVQYVADVDRFRLMRAAGIGYAQVTKERMASPRSVVREIHQRMVAGGYTGRPPDFGDTFQLLFRPLSEVVTARRQRAG